MAYVAIADQGQELHDPQSFITKYVWSQDHKVIAIQYSITAIAVGLVALVLSGMMRLQLGFPNSFSFIDPQSYYQFVTMHGMIMVIYLLTALFLGGFGNYLVPLMCGARDMVFPFMNMVSYWVYLVAVLVLMASFFVPGGPTGAGWTLYPPQAILPGTPGADGGIVLMLVSLALFIVAFTMGGLNYVTTALQARTRGMTLMRMPLSVWGIVMATILGLLAFPALLVSAIMMLLDRTLGTSFFMPALLSMGDQLEYNGGSPVLFQHLFWFFGHPEVYIVALPAFGIVSDLLSVHARKNILGYRMMVWAIPGAGWTLYPPQAILPGTPGADGGIVLMLVSLALFIVAFTMGGLNYVTTALQARTRGMTLMRMPLSVWGIVMATILGLLAFPALLVSAIMMLLDRTLGTSFFMPALLSMGDQLEYNGGSPVLFQHLFWFFGHPEVYIVALPAFGIVSDLLSVHARKNIFGYRMMVWAIIAIGALSFVVWAHHMYVSGMHPYFGFFFATTTLIIAVPTRRIRQLSGSIDVRRQRHGFPVHEYGQLLGIPGGSIGADG